MGCFAPSYFTLSGMVCLHLLSAHPSLLHRSCQRISKKAGQARSSSWSWEHLSSMAYICFTLVSRTWLILLLMFFQWVLVSSFLSSLLLLSGSFDFFYFKTSVSIFNFSFFDRFFQTVLQTVRFFLLSQRQASLFWFFCFSFIFSILG